MAPTYRTGNDDRSSRPSLIGGGKGRRSGGGGGGGGVVEFVGIADVTSKLSKSARLLTAMVDDDDNDINIKHNNNGIGNDNNRVASVGGMSSYVDDSNIDDDIYIMGGSGDGDSLYYDDDSDDDCDSDSYTSDTTGESTAVNSAIATKSFRLMHKLRQVVILSFVYLAIFLPILVYITSRKSEVSAFENEFDALSTKVIESFQLKFARLLSAMDSASVSTTSYALDGNLTFPYVTLLDFDLIGGSVAALAETRFVATFPLVQDIQRNEWENNYTITNDWWLWDAIDRQTSVAGTSGSGKPFRQRSLHEGQEEEPEQQQQQVGQPQQLKEEEIVADTSLGYAKEIWRIGYTNNNNNSNNNDSPSLQLSTIPIVETSYRVYFPLWQSFPPSPRFINFNLLSQDFALNAMSKLLSSKQAVMTDLVHSIDEFYIWLTNRYATRGKPSSSSSSSSNNSTTTTNKNTDNDNEEDESDNNVLYEGEPTTLVFYPIYDTFDVATKRNVVGVVGTAFFWHTIFENILPNDNKNGIICVIETQCGGIFTMEINGNGATFLGNDDYHDTDFDYLHKHFKFSTINNNDKFKFSSTFASLNSDYCTYSMHVYPSDQLQQQYISNSPYISAIYVFVAFILISFISMTYDCLVQRRMRRIIKAAKENRAIVSSIFPENIRRRLFDDELGPSSHHRRRTTTTDEETGGHNVGGGSGGGGGMNVAHPKVRLKSYLNSDNNSNNRRGSAFNDGGMFGPDMANIIDGDDDLAFLQVKPIADLFPYCTVLFANISGFSAWSSEREPEQVFTLLESIFRTFDKIARKRSVFKVETIGDTYVAVTGLPDQQPDHAIRMCRFARDCLIKVNGLTKGLEMTLGPDTGELRLRFGLHSGQVTAGVLRGQKSRFQLFGDTVNTASRMESTGQRNRIQLSHTTAQLLIEAGKERWITQREDAVNAKGKGVIQTYWLQVQDLHGGSNYAKDNASVISVSMSSQFSCTSSTSAGFSDDVDNNKRHGNGFGFGDNYSNHSTSFGGMDDSTTNDDEDHSNSNRSDRGGNSDDIKQSWGLDKGVFALPPSSRQAKKTRLVAWLTELMALTLKAVIVQRDNIDFQRGLKNPDSYVHRGDLILDELVEAFIMPKFDTQTSKKRISTVDTVELPPEVMSQLKDYVSAIADRYHVNPFHNFEHASHVTMSSIKLLKRIVIPEDVNYRRDSMNAIASDIHRYTFGINSDALAQFAVVFSALVHDVDHMGVPNGQLSKEKPNLGEKYKYQSVAEQNSIDVAWDLLMHPAYKDLQACIFTTERELKRFRQYIVNLVIATDIFNKELKAFRNERWDKAFNMIDTTDNETTTTDESLHSSLSIEGTNLKATIVLEHIIQASDVSHTMQHWNVYKKWNERLFQEMYAAFDHGRADKDPSEGWYKGELWFFDNYIIPLAQKLEECGVFGVSSDEYLNYALENRKEWALKGRDLVLEMKNRYQQRKMLEIGGFTPDEIDDFSSHDLEFLIKRLIKKGRTFATFDGPDKDSNKRNAARAWFDALEIFEKCSGSKKLKDRGIIFPVFSEFMVYVKGGMIRQDDDHIFEQNLAKRFCKDAKSTGNIIHIMRSSATRCSVLARLGNYDEAFEAVADLEAKYDPKLHSPMICKFYGTDQAAKTYSIKALWYHHLQNEDEVQKSCDYVIQNILPNVDPTNILTAFEVLLPIIRLQKFRGKQCHMRELFDKFVLQRYHKRKQKNNKEEDSNNNNARGTGTSSGVGTGSSSRGRTSTRCTPIFKPLSLLLEMSCDPETTYLKAKDWFEEELTNGIMDDFLDNFYGELCWAPSTMIAELCLLVSRYLLTNSKKVPFEQSKSIILKGLQAAERVHSKLKCIESGKVRFPIAYEIHEPIRKDLLELGQRAGIELEDVQKTIETEEKQHNVQEQALKTSLGVVRLRT